MIHSADMRTEGADSDIVVALAGARTFLSVPMLKDNELIGAIGIYRQQVRPFTDKQIELVQNFAAQGSFRRDGEVKWRRQSISRFAVRLRA